MAFGTKTNERPGTRAQARYIRMSPSKAREVLDLIRGRSVAEAADILRLVERDAALVITKVLDSAVANAVANDDQEPERLYVSACYADEGPTLKRFRPRARGRASTIRKRTCHITIIVSRMSEAEIARLDKAEAATGGGRGRRVSASRAARVARSRAQDADKAGLDTEDGDETTDTVGAPDDVVASEETPDTASDTGPDTDTDDDADAAVTTQTDVEDAVDDTADAADTEEPSEAKETD